MISGKSFRRINSYYLVRLVLLSFYVLSVFMGFTVQIYDKSKGKVYTSKIFAFYSISLSVIMIIHYKSSDLLFSRSDEQSMVAKAVSGIEATLLINVMLIGTIRRYITRRNSEELFDDFMRVQKSINYTPVDLYRILNMKALKMVMIGIILLTISIVFITIHKLETESELWIIFDVFTTMYPKALIVNLASWYYLEVLYVRRYLELVNDMLNNLHHKIARELHIIRFGKCSTKYSYQLLRIMMIRSQIITLSSRLNKFFSLQMLTVFTLISVLVLSQMYSLFLSVYRLNSNSSSGMLYRDLTILFVFMLVSYEAYCIADVCELATEESNKTSEILHRYNSLHMDAQLKQTVEMFLIQLMHHPIKFTACGMFTLDYSVLFSIITSATSYLIILIQFELADNCKKG